MNPEIDRVFWLAEGVRRYGHFALGGLAAICLMSGNYAPLMERATERFLESEGKALWQLQERADAARSVLLQVVAEAEQAVRDAEERRRRREEAEQQAAEERLRRAQAQEGFRQSYATNLAAFNATVAPYREMLAVMATAIALAEEEWEKTVRKPGYFDRSKVTLGEVSTRDPCDNPASLSRMFDIDGNRRHNLLACVIHYASKDSHAQANPLHRHTITYISLRATGKVSDFPLFFLFVYHWYLKITQAANRGGFIPSPPALFSGDALSNRMLDGVDSGFMALVTDTAANNDILALRDAAHPDMVKLATIARQMSDACRVLAISPCIPTLIDP